MIKKKAASRTRLPLKLKVKHKSRIFQLSKVLIINKLKHKNET